MSDEKKPATDEERRRLLAALEKGDVQWSEHGQEYWQRAGVIAREPDFTVVKATAKFWEAYRVKRLDGTIAGNDGGVEISWQTVSAGFGGLTIWLKDGRVGADTECMGKDFCRAVLAALDAESQQQVASKFGLELDALVDQWVED